MAELVGGDRLEIKSWGIIFRGASLSAYFAEKSPFVIEDYVEGKNLSAFYIVPRVSHCNSTAAIIIGRPKEDDVRA